MKLPYDQKLGEITDQDREYARDMVDDLGMALDDYDIGVIAEWFRKVRYEAVIADRSSERTGRQHGI